MFLNNIYLNYFKNKKNVDARNKIYSFWNNKRIKCNCWKDNKECLKLDYLDKHLHKKWKFNVNKSLSTQIYNLEFNPSEIDRDFVLYHFNKYIKSKNNININKICVNVDIYNKYIKKKCNSNTNWTIDIHIWFFIMFIKSNQIIINNRHNNELLLNCMKYICYNEVMYINSGIFTFHIPIPNYEKYYFQNKNIEKEITKISHIYLYTKRFKKIFEYEKYTLNTKFNNIYKLQKEQKEKKFHLKFLWRKFYKNMYLKKQMKISKEEKKEILNNNIEEIIDELILIKEKKKKPSDKILKNVKKKLKIIKTEIYDIKNNKHIYDNIYDKLKKKI